MSRIEPGLQLRIKRVLRQMQAQHRHLKPIFQALGEALARGDPDRARTAFGNYWEALEAHFALEDEFFFPALHGLAPDVTSDLNQLIEEHRRFREQARSLEALLRTAELERCARAMDGFSAELAQHEALEERVVGRLEL